MIPDVERMHPLVDAVDADGVVITSSDREVVALTPLRADLLIACVRARRPVRLVTPATSRLTDPMRDALDAAAGTWQVHDGAGGVWDGLRGLDATAGEPRIAPQFLRPIGDTLQLVVAASLRHRAEAGARVGPAIEAVSRWGGAAAPDGWGPHEPVEHAWDPPALTRHLAARAPEEARVLFAGASVVGSTLTTRTDKGVEEVLQAVVGVGPVGADATGEVLRGLPRSLAALAEDAMPLFAMVFSRPGRADLTTTPTMQAPPAPAALLIGAPGVRDLGIDVGVLRETFGGVVVGRPRIPGVVVPFLGPDGGWPAFERFVDAAGRDRIGAIVGAVPRREA